MRVLWLAFLVAAALAGQPRRVLYITYSAGFVHDSIAASVEALTAIAAQDGQLEVVQTEDLGTLNAATLQGFDAVFFFTSGELPISDSQKQDLLNFVRGGKGFGGAHSATDTFYTWPEYGDLIGARFNGHPWTQQAAFDVEDPDHPAVAHLAPGFTLLEEIYQFRDFSRDRARVLLTLDAHSVDLGAPDVNPGTEDFPVAWCSRYGSGRVFYTAFGHFDSTWRDPGFRQMLRGALLWLTGQVDGDATPRPARPPSFAPEGIANSASFEPRMTVAAGSLITLFGANLTAGSAVAADARHPPYKLAGTAVKLNGVTVPLLYASPTQINAYAPLDLAAPDGTFALELIEAGGGPSGTAAATLRAAGFTPGIFTVTVAPNAVTLWATGLGPVQANGDLQATTTQPEVTIGGMAAKVLFSGLAPGWVGLYQVSVQPPPGVTFPALLEFRFGSYQWSEVVH